MEGRGVTLIRRAAMPLAALAGFGLLWVVRPGVVENAARSPVAWAVIAGTLLAGLGVRVAARRLGASPVLAQALGTGLIVVLVAALLAPSFRQRTVVEDLPDALTAVPRLTGSAVPLVVPTPAVSTAAATPPSTTAPATTRPPGGPPATGPAAPVTKPAASTTAPAATKAPTAAPTTAAPAPSGAVDRTGALRGIGHTASGTVHLRTLDGKAYVVFQDVNIEGTVEPSVHLVSAGQRTPSGGVRLGPLKAEKGTFSYTLPSSVDPTRDWSVLVWCDPYDTPIAAADPR